MNNYERNDLLYVCSLIEYIGRVTNNHRGYVVKCIGHEGLKHLYEVASTKED